MFNWECLVSSTSFAVKLLHISVEVPTLRKLKYNKSSSLIVEIPEHWHDAGMPEPAMNLYFSAQHRVAAASNNRLLHCNLEGHSATTRRV